MSSACMNLEMCEFNSLKGLAMCKWESALYQPCLGKLLQRLRVTVTSRFSLGRNNTPCVSTRYSRPLKILIL